MVRPALVFGSLLGAGLFGCVSVQLPELPASHPANPTAPSAPLVIRTQIEPYRPAAEEPPTAPAHGMPGMQHGTPSPAPTSPAAAAPSAAPTAADHAAMGHGQADRSPRPGRPVTAPSSGQGHAGHGGAAGAAPPAKQSGQGQGRRDADAQAAHAHGTSAAGQTADASRASRTVRVTARDAMRFEPAAITVERGETVRFVVTNAGKLAHEFCSATPRNSGRTKP